MSPSRLHRKNVFLPNSTRSIAVNVSNRSIIDSARSIIVNDQYTTLDRFIFYKNIIFFDKTNLTRLRAMLALISTQWAFNTLIATVIMC